MTLIFIEQVTKLDRDPSSGTALQEISFWLNLERALHRIQEKRESLEVALTLDILKHGKRFHATVSFDTDTGINAFCSFFGHVLTQFVPCMYYLHPKFLGLVLPSVNILSPGLLATVTL
jgi:hypothetical protein